MVLINSPHAVGPRPKLRIGISTCLLGEEVRHDGGHKRDQILMDTLGQYFEWAPFALRLSLALAFPENRFTSSKVAAHRRRFVYKLARQASISRHGC